MATIREVSKRAGVSPSTVSRVLNDTARVSEVVRERVIKAIEELNYQPNSLARALATQRSGGVGVVVNSLASDYCGELLIGIEQVTEAAGMHLMVSSGHAEVDAEHAAIEFLMQRHADALILQLEAMPRHDIDQLVNRCKGKVPLVFLGRELKGLPQHSVYLDDVQGAEQATEHLLAQGHKRIAHITAPLVFGDGALRLEGYRKALHAAEIVEDPQLIIEAQGREAHHGYLAMATLLARNVEMSAVFVSNDHMAAGALRYLRECDVRVPEALSVMGYDDLRIAEFVSPALSTMRQPLHAMGARAAEIALAQLRCDRHADTQKLDQEVQTVFKPALVVRDSVQAWPA